MTIRILHTYKAYKPDPTGGIAEVIARIVADCGEYENTILVARMRGSSHTFRQDSATIRAVFSFGTTSSLPIAPSYPLALATIARKFDLIVHHAPFPLADLGLLIPRPHCTGLIVYWHADLVRSNLVVRSLAPFLRHSLKCADRIVVSHDIVAQNSSLLRPFADKCVVIPYAVDWVYWSNLVGSQNSEASSLRCRFPRLIAAAGRLVPYKGFNVLLKALRQIDAQLIIIGAGPLQRELERNIRSFGLSDRVLLTGQIDRDEMKFIFHAARVFAFPSVTPAEAFGLVQLEAMASGLPVINTSLPTAVPEVARHGAEALTVMPNDPKALAAALVKVLDDEEFAARLGQAGQERARKEFSPDAFCKGITELYEEVLQSRKKNQ